MIFTTDELSKIEIEDNVTQLNIIVDVHGMKCREVKRFLNNIINLIRGRYLMTVIHGYIHGNAIEEMIAKETINYKITKRYQDTWQYGVTYLQVS